MFCSGALTAPAALRRMQVAKFCSCVKRSKWYFLQQHVLRVSTCFQLYNHVYSVAYFMSFYLFENFPSLRQQGKCCKPTAKFCSPRATQHAAGNKCASGTLLPAQTMCDSNKAFKNSFLEVSLCCVLPCSPRTEWEAKGTVRIGLCSQVDYLLDVLTLPLPLQEEHGINPLQGEVRWSCPLRIFTWPFCGATIVSEGTALDAGDQGYCLLKTNGQAGRFCALTLSVTRIVHKCACFLTLQTQSCKCWGNSWYLNFLYLPIFNSGSK